MPLFDPPVGFHFLVRFEGLLLNPKYIGIPDLGFKEVSGINADISTEEYHEGGENRFKHRLPQPATYQNLVMKRGLLIGSQLMQWFKESTENFSFEPSDITVVLLNGDHIPLQAWNFIQAYPVKWQIAELNATDAQILIETVEFSYQYFRRIDPTDLLPF
ncbi:MAG: phage tail protein [Flavobacteriales bacterium]|nr:phage tail protein [Flavobacteriales bacterium]MCB9448596.1 phage tail protein [Flavobacteriales bacterium]